MREIKIQKPQAGRPVNTPVNTPPPVEAKRSAPPFTGRDPARNYRAMYRAACEFHERNAQIPENRADVESYYARVVDDMEATGRGNDPFLTGLLLAVFDELDRECKAAFEQP